MAEYCCADTGGEHLAGGGKGSRLDITPPGVDADPTSSEPHISWWRFFRVPTLLPPPGQFHSWDQGPIRTKLLDVEQARRDGHSWSLRVLSRTCVCGPGDDSAHWPPQHSVPKDKKAIGPRSQPLGRGV